MIITHLESISAAIIGIEHIQFFIIFIYISLLLNNDSILILQYIIIIFANLISKNYDTSKCQMYINEIASTRSANPIHSRIYCSIYQWQLPLENSILPCAAQRDRWPEILFSRLQKAMSINS